MFSVWFWLIPDSTALALIQFPPRDKLISFSYTVEHTLGYAMICSPILDRSFLFYKCLFSESWHNTIWINSPNSSNGSWTAIHKALCCYKLCCVQGELYKSSLLVCKRVTLLLNTHQHDGRCEHKNGIVLYCILCNNNDYKKKFVIWDIIIRYNNLLNIFKLYI